MSLEDYSIGLFMSMTCIPVVGHLKVFRTLLLSLCKMNFLLSHVARQLSHSFPKDESAGSELHGKSDKFY